MNVPENIKCFFNSTQVLTVKRTDREKNLLESKWCNLSL